MKQRCGRLTAATADISIVDQIRIFCRRISMPTAINVGFSLSIKFVLSSNISFVDNVGCLNVYRTSFVA